MIELRKDDWQYLDYDKAKLKMFATSTTELKLRVNACKKEPETVAFLESIPRGSVFYDIGANVGSYTIIAAHLGLKTYAFEPVGVNYIRLMENLALNELKAEVYSCLLWSNTGSVGFKLSSEETGAALHEVNPRGESWACWSLDDWVEWSKARPPKYMKVDVDGGELNVLRGATRTLQGVKALQVEVDDTKSPGVLLAFLKKCGFTQTEWTRHGDTAISNVRFDR